MSLVKPADSIDPPQSTDRVRVEQALREVIHSSPFHASKQCQELLRYLVNNSLQVPERSLKERVIGTEVFGRPPDYDTGEDPIVRARVGEVRKRLAQYYQSEEAANSTIQILIPSGSYRATFLARRPQAISQRDEHTPVLPQPKPRLVDDPPEVAPGVTKPVRGRTGLLAARAAVVSIALLGLGFVFVVGVMAKRLLLPGPVDLFWAPVLQTTKPILLYTGTNPVSLSVSALKPASPGASAGTEANDDFVSVGDMSANVSVVSLLTTRRHSFDLRAARDVSFGDLRESPAVLIGGFSNFWTLQMTNDLKYRFERRDEIRENGGKGRVWTAGRTPDGGVTEDYAVVSRLMVSRSGNAVITLAGMTHFGTQAAAEFVTNPAALRQFAETAPGDWSSRNLQVLLRTRVVHGTPSPATVVAAYFW